MSELEQLAKEYDQAILAYEGYFQRQQQRANALAYNWGGISAPYGAGVTPAIDLQSCAERLEFLEKTAGDFTAAQAYLQNLSGEEKTAYVESWREYLTQTATMGDELIRDLEQELSGCGNPEMESKGGD